MTIKPDVVIFHYPCPDGFTSAWVIRRRFDDGSIRFLHGTHGEPPNMDVIAGKHVLMLDFTYKRDVLVEMSKVAKTITILDHHKSAQEDLADFIRPLVPPEEFLSHVEFEAVFPIQARFDMDRSGAMLTWQYAYGDGTLVPKIVSYVQDRDLWLHALPYSKEVNAVILSYHYSRENWDKLESELENNFVSVVSQGTAILRKQDKDIAELLESTTRSMIIGGTKVPVANLPYTMVSEAAGILAATPHVPFAACYFDRNDGQRIFSLRSAPDGADVSVIAQLYGGGGHKHSSGFQAALGWEGDASA